MKTIFKPYEPIKKFNILSSKLNCQMCFNKQACIRDNLPNENFVFFLISKIQILARSHYTPFKFNSCPSNIHVIQYITFTYIYDFKFFIFYIECLHLDRLQ